MCIPLAAYYNFTQLFLSATGFEKIAGTQILGQISEAVFMVLMPLLFARLGVKWMLAVGMLAWGVRYVLFALAAPSSVFWMIVLGVLLHGISTTSFSSSIGIADPSRLRRAAGVSPVVIAMPLQLHLGPLFRLSR